MSENLMTAGIIHPNQWPLARVWLEVSTGLGVAPRQIERLEFWPHQIWVKLVGKGSIFVSYRRLPLWTEQSLSAIESCSDRSNLDKLGALFSNEIKQYKTHYGTEVIEQWRSAWAEKAKQLKAEALRQAQEEERLKPLRMRQQAYQQWQDSWQLILHYCRNLESLERLAAELEEQRQEFADLPEAQTIKQLWDKRKQELIQATA